MLTTQIHIKGDEEDRDADEDKDEDDGEDDDEEDDEGEEDDGTKDACVTGKQGLPHSTIWIVRKGEMAVRTMMKEDCSLVNHHQ